MLDDDFENDRFEEEFTPIHPIVNIRVTPPSVILDRQFTLLQETILELRAQVLRLEKENKELRAQGLKDAQIFSARTLQLALSGALTDPKTPLASLGYDTNPAKKEL